MMIHSLTKSALMIMNCVVCIAQRHTNMMVSRMSNHFVMDPNLWAVV